MIFNLNQKHIHTVCLMVAVRAAPLYYRLHHYTVGFIIVADQNYHHCVYTINLMTFHKPIVVVGL